MTCSCPQPDEYPAILDDLPLPYQSLDAAGRFLFVNQAWLDLLGCRKEEVIGRFFGEFVHESSQALLGVSFDNFKRDGYISSPVFAAKHQTTGEIILVTVNGRITRDETTGLVRTHCVLADVSSRVKAESDLLSLHKLLQQLTEHLPGMVLQYRMRPDGSACIPYTSQGIRQLLQVAPEDVCDDASSAFRKVHADDLAALQESIEKSALTGQQWRHRFRVQGPDGTPRWLEGHATPQREEDGGYLWHGFLNDVTQQVTDESNLRIAASVYANSQEGITITDAGGFIADINLAFTRITGYSRDEVLGRTPRILSSGHQDATFYQKMWADLHQKGRWRGEIWNRHKSGEVYSELLSITAVHDAAGLISHYIGTFSDISGLKSREAQLDRIAHHDPLTGMPNRRLLEDRLQQMVAQTRRAGKMAAICVLDFDNFKPINDSYGYMAGDKILQEIARRLAALVRDSDTVARIGSDEFALLLPDLQWVEESTSILNRLLREVTLPIEFDGRTLQVAASIGVTLAPQDSGPPDALLAHAEQALDQAKQAGGNRYQFFNPEHDRLIRDYRRLVEDLEIALARDEFTLHYQPKVNMVTGETVGVEALIRWRHPERGLLLPAEFLYATAYADLEIQIDSCVIAKSLKQQHYWKAQGLNLPISINLTARSLLDDSFASRLAVMLAGYPDLTAADLEIEILESGALDHGLQASVAIKDCSAIGIRFALDDFGAGYSSPADYRRLQADILKIAPVYIRGMCHDAEDLAIVDGVIKIAKGFNLEVVAKGVETSAQIDQLRKLGCCMMQGYAIARPMPADSLARWLTVRPKLLG